jgi:hypothetical protein
MDYLWTQYISEDVDGFTLITNLQKQLVLFLNLFKKTWVTGTFVCVEDASGREYAQDKMLIKHFIPVC